MDAMKHLYRKILTGGLLMALGLLGLNTANAGVFDSLSASPASKNIAVGQLATFSITWSINSAHPAAATLQLNSATDGLSFEDAEGNVLGRPVTGAFARTATLQQSVRLNSTFTETVIVPPDIIFKARENRSNRVVVKRRFTGSILETAGKPQAITAAAVGVVMLNISTSSSQTELSVVRFRLSFENGQLARTINHKDHLTATAEIQTQGTGIIRGVWEVAEPPSTRGTPFFRPLSNVSKQVSGLDSFELRSPDLPSEQDGLYLLRFRLTEPVLDSVPLIRYQTKYSDKANAVLRRIDLGNPPARAYMSKGMEFSWLPIQEAKYYQIEFFMSPVSVGGEEVKPDLDKARRVAGMLVLGKNYSQALSELTRMHFNSGFDYYWHVIAIDAEGRRMGRSELRKIVVP